MRELTYIGKTDWRNSNVLFGIKDADRFGHIYCIGKTGVGKSTLLLNMAISDIVRGHGLCVIDPHGDIAEALLNHVPEKRIQDVIYVNPKDVSHPIAFNPLRCIDPTHYHLVVSGLIATFKKIWGEFWGPRLEYILRFALLSLIEYPQSTLLDIQPMLTDSSFRADVLQYVTNQHVLAFWKNEYERYTPSLRSEAISPILNKVGVFATNTILRNIIGQIHNSIDVQEVLDEKKIMIVNLSKGELGEDVSSLLGNMIITSLQLSALYRSAIPEQERVPFFLYIDEMHSFVTHSFVDILAEARKYKLSLFLSHQYIDQIPEKIRMAIFGNVGTIISFKVGASDAKLLESEFSPVLTPSDFINLPKYAMYIKLMIDGVSSRPFSAVSLPSPAVSQTWREKIIQASRTKYASPQKHQSRQQHPHQTNVQTLFDAL